MRFCRPTGRRYGTARVCQLWEVPRSTVYARRARAGRPAQPAAKRGPKGAGTDAALTEQIRAVLAPLAVRRRGLPQGLGAAAPGRRAHLEGPGATADAGGGAARPDPRRAPPWASEPRRHDHHRPPRRAVGNRRHRLPHHPRGQRHGLHRRRPLHAGVRRTTARRGSAATSWAASITSTSGPRDILPPHGRQTAVELDLGVAVRLATLGGDLVDEPEVDGLLRLVDEITSQEDVGDVRLHQFHAVGCVRIGGRIKEGLDVGGESGELPGGQAASGVAIGIVVATATLAHARTVESGRATVKERTARVWRLDTIVALPELLGLLSWQDVGSFGPLSYPYGSFSYCGPGVTESDPSDGPVGRRLAGFVPARDEASLSAKSDWRRR